MCYDVKAQTERQLKTARYYGYKDAIEELEEKLRKMGASSQDSPLFHVSGFSHPEMIIYTDTGAPMLSTWGLVPHWVKDKVQLKKIWNSTLNARGETIFEKPSFRDAAKHKRCLICVDGFYEHHHTAGETFPFYITTQNGDPLILAGLWSEWTDRDTGEILNTFSIVTTKANSLMAKIHKIS